MFSRIVLFTLGAALGSAAPALAQDTAQQPSASDTAMPPAAAPDAMASPDVVTVRNISPVELSAGLAIVDGSGKPVGTVKKVAGNSIIITDGNADYRVPITELYAYRDGAADHFASRVPKSAMTAEQEGG